MRQDKIGVILLFLFAIPLVQAASFDCNKAQTKVETLICTFPQLGEADEQLGQLYAQALKSLPTLPATQLREEQRAWMEERDRYLLTACMDQNCLTTTQTPNSCFNADRAVSFYARRISALKGESNVSKTTNQASLTASFDCTKASTRVERMICGRPKLSHLDGRLDQVYKSLQRTLTEPEVQKLQQEQSAWLKERNNHLLKCGKNTICASEVYENRIAVLSARLNATNTNPPEETSLRHVEDTSTIIGRYDLGGYMSLQVKPLIEDHVLIKIEGAEPTAGKWTCDFSGVGTLIEDTVTICHPEQRTPILFTLTGNEINVSGDHLDYFCGRGMTIGGRYKKSR